MKVEFNGERISIEGVLSDLDGTITDTEGLMKDINSEFIEANNLHKHFGFEEVSDLPRQPGKDFTQNLEIWIESHLSKGHSLQFDLASILEAWRQWVYEKLTETRQIVIFEETIQLLQSLKETQLPIGLVTNNIRKAVEAIIESDPRIKDIIGDKIITSDEAKNKPDGDGYQKGAGLIGVVPSKILAIEDSLTGVMGAIKAGIGYILLIDRDSQVDLSQMAETAKSKIWQVESLEAINWTA